MQLGWIFNFFFFKKNIKNKVLFNVHQLKRGYALNLSILLSAAQKKKLTRIPLVTASEVGNNLFYISPTI